MIYLATPFTHYPHGPEAAFIEAARIAGKLSLRGHAVFSPIAHGHAMAVHAEIDAYDAALWESINRPFVALCSECWVAMMDGWRDSDGIRQEIEDFTCADKVVRYLDPKTLRLSMTPEEIRFHMKGSMLNTIGAE